MIWGSRLCLENDTGSSDFALTNDNMAKTPKLQLSECTMYGSGNKSLDDLDAQPVAMILILTDATHIVEAEKLRLWALPVFALDDNC